MVDKGVSDFFYYPTVYGDVGCGDDCRSKGKCNKHCDEAAKVGRYDSRRLDDQMGARDGNGQRRNQCDCRGRRILIGLHTLLPRRLLGLEDRETQRECRSLVYFAFYLYRTAKILHNTVNDG